jgi:Zn-finger nucleic acid-binding protein
MWVSRRDLEKMKKAEDEYLGWVHLDLWKDHEDSTVVRSEKRCPQCSKKMVLLKYPGTDIEIDLCDSCESVWLEKGELEKLVNYLKDRINNETVAEYIRELGHELKEVFIGKDEVADILKVLKLLEYRIFTEFPFISKMISKVPPA